MNIQQDFEELLGLFARHNVDFLVVGGYAVAFHGTPRFTKDIDIFYNRTPDNIDKLVKALLEFGIEKEDIPPELFSTEGNIVTFGVEPVRVDLINKIDGVTYAEAFAGRVTGQYGNVKVFFIGRDQLLKNKTSTQRAQDKADAESLQ